MKIWANNTIILFMGFSRQEYWSALPFSSPVDHVLSDLSTMTRPYWVALHGMAHRFIEYVTQPPLIKVSMIACCKHKEFLTWKLVAQSCLILCDPMDCSPPGSPDHGILQARILEWVAIPSSRGSSWPSDWPLVSCIADGSVTIWATREAWRISERTPKNGQIRSLGNHMKWRPTFSLYTFWCCLEF